MTNSTTNHASVHEIVAGAIQASAITGRESTICCNSRDCQADYRSVCRELADECELSTRDYEESSYVGYDCDGRIWRIRVIP